MGTAPNDANEDDLLDQFLSQRGHETASWEQEYNKKRCPECGGIHDTDAPTCSVCGWAPGS